MKCLIHKCLRSNALGSVQDITPPSVLSTPTMVGGGPDYFIPWIRNLGQEMAGKSSWIQGICSRLFRPLVCGLSPLYRPSLPKRGAEERRVSEALPHSESRPFSPLGLSQDAPAPSPQGRPGPRAFLPRVRGPAQMALHLNAGDVSPSWVS